METMKYRCFTTGLKYTIINFPKIIKRWRQNFTVILQKSTEDTHYAHRF